MSSAYHQDTPIQSFIDLNNPQITSIFYLKNYTYLQYCIFPQLFQIYLNHHTSIKQTKWLLISYVQTLLEFCPELANYERFSQSNIAQDIFINNQEKNIQNINKINKITQQINLDYNKWINKISSILYKTKSQDDKIKQKIQFYQIIAQKIQIITPFNVKLYDSILNQIHLTTLSQSLFELICKIVEHLIFNLFKSTQNQCQNDNQPQIQFNQHLYEWQVSNFLWRIILQTLINKRKNKLIEMRKNNIMTQLQDQLKITQQMLYLQILPYIKQLEQMYEHIKNMKTKQFYLIRLQSIMSKQNQPNELVNEQENIVSVYWKYLQSIIQINQFVVKDNQKIQIQNKKQEQSFVKKLMKKIQKSLNMMDKKDKNKIEEQKNQQNLKSQPLEMNNQELEKISKIIIASEIKEKQSKTITANLSSYKNIFSNGLLNVQQQQLNISKSSLNLEQNPYMQDFLYKYTQLLQLTSSSEQPNYIIKIIQLNLKNWLCQINNSISFILISKSSNEYQFEEYMDELQSVRLKVELMLSFCDKLVLSREQCQIVNLNKVKMTAYVCLLVCKIINQILQSDNYETDNKRTEENQGQVVDFGQIQLKQQQSPETIDHKIKFIKHIRQSLNEILQISSSFAYQNQQTHHKTSSHQPYLQSILYLMSALNLYTTIQHTNKKQCKKVNNLILNQLHSFYQMIISSYSKIHIPQNQFKYVRMIINICEIIKKYISFISNNQNEKAEHQLCQYVIEIYTNCNQAEKDDNFFMLINFVPLYNLMIFKLIPNLWSGLLFNNFNLYNSTQQDDQFTNKCVFHIDFNQVIRAQSQQNHQIKSKQQLIKSYMNKQILNRMFKNKNQIQLDTNLTNITITELFKKLFKKQQQFNLISSNKNNDKNLNNQIVQKDKEMIRQCLITKIYENINHQVRLEQMLIGLTQLFVEQFLTNFIDYLQHLSYNIDKQNKSSQKQSNQIIYQIRYEKLIYFLQKVNITIKKLIGSEKNTNNSSLTQLLQLKNKLFKVSSQQSNSKTINIIIQQYQEITDKIIDLSVLLLTKVLWLKMQIQINLITLNNKVNLNKTYKINPSLTAMRYLILLSYLPEQYFSIDYQSLSSYFNYSYITLSSLSASSTRLLLPQLQLSSSIITQLSFIGSVTPYQLIEFLYEYFPFQIQNQNQEKFLYQKINTIILNEDNHQFVSEQKYKKIKYIKLQSYLHNLILQK